MRKRYLHQRSMISSPLLGASWHAADEVVWKYPNDTRRGIARKPRCSETSELLHEVKRGVLNRDVSCPQSKEERGQGKRSMDWITPECVRSEHARVRPGGGRMGQTDLGEGIWVNKERRVEACA